MTPQFQILARVVGSDRSENTLVLFSSTSSVTQGKLIAGIRAAIERDGLKLARPTLRTGHNWRRVKVLGIPDNPADILESVTLGLEFPSSKVASVSLGLAPNTVTQLFARTGSDRITVRGYELQLLPKDAPKKKA